MKRERDINPFSLQSSQLKFPAGASNDDQKDKQHDNQSEAAAITYSRNRISTTSISVSVHMETSSFV
jgi:hypothetical protein